MKQNKKYVVLCKHPTFGCWEPLRWVSNDEVVVYDSYYEALHDCRKGSKIVTTEQWKQMQS